ncbi:MAG: hypothetical protein QNK27_14345 [Desulfuromusa sp.]|nr:hypothetical protein [Desulfuromusa sp.]
MKWLPGMVSMLAWRQKNLEFSSNDKNNPAVEYGAAHGALAMITPGDTTMASIVEVEKIVSGGGARVDR